MAKWLPPNGFTCTVHHLDAKVGRRTLSGRTRQGLNGCSLRLEVSAHSRRMPLRCLDTCPRRGRRQASPSSSMCSFRRTTRPPTEAAYSLLSSLGWTCCCCCITGWAFSAIMGGFRRFLFFGKPQPSLRHVEFLHIQAAGGEIELSNSDLDKDAGKVSLQRKVLFWRLKPVEAPLSDVSDIKVDTAVDRASGVEVCHTVLIRHTGEAWALPAAFAGLTAHRPREWVILAHLFLLLMGFAILSRHRWR